MKTESKNEGPNDSMRLRLRPLDEPKRSAVVLLIVGIIFGLAGPVLTGHSGESKRGGGTSFFVATNGNDAWSGRLPAPNRAGTDGPFATLKKAVQSSRSERSPGRFDWELPTIQVRGGSFLLDEPLKLGPEHSGMTLAAYKKEKPLISGGKRITAWKETMVSGRPCWTAELPDVRQGKWFFGELWVNGTRATRARHPNHGYLKVAAVPDTTPQWQDGQTRFQFKEGDLRDWKTLRNAELVVMSRWVESRLPIKAIDEKEHMVTFGKRSVFQLGAGDPYYVEHAFEALDEPGEWYLDRETGTLYYLPRPGEKLGLTEVFAPVLTELMRVEGRPESTQFVQNVTFKGLTFSHNEWYFPGGFSPRTAEAPAGSESKLETGGFSQAAIGVPAAVTAIGARNCRFDQCNFSHLGSYGLELGRGCQSNLVTHCTFSDLSAGGLKMGEPVLRERPEEVARSNGVMDCDIHDGGRVFHSAIGVWIGQSPDNTLSHNSIHDFYYTGISIGWTWGYGPSLASNNLVEFNHVHHIGVLSNGDGPILSDMGGIYTLGKQPGTRILNNLWHDAAGLSYGGWGIYLDEGSSGVLVESNVVYRTTHGGFHQHYGETNLLLNNIFAFARDQQLQRSRSEPHLSFTFETNIVYFDHGLLLGSTWSDDRFAMDHNLFWDTRLGSGATNSIPFAGGTLEKWRARGHDQHSLVADPLFVGPMVNDFRLKPNSPAFKAGFEPIDLRHVGPRP